MVPCFTTRLEGIVIGAEFERRTANVVSTRLRASAATMRWPVVPPVGCGIFLVAGVAPYQTAGAAKIRKGGGWRRQQHSTCGDVGAVQVLHERGDWRMRGSRAMARSRHAGFRQTDRQTFVFPGPSNS